jgi:Asp-tRNA(Asn)/Glu-tRNA(Gln) amidotransferase A subunit family amidase
VQARNPKLLTGGSSSGAAASVQEGSSLIGLGTDTGGSIRVPSALCGLVGFRLTPAVTRNRGMFPLAPTFDACGWVQQSLSDLQLVYSALQGSKPPSRPLARARIAFLDGDWLAPCEAPIRIAFERLFGKLQETGARVVWEQAPDFERAPEIFSAIQAYEAARIHRGFLGRPRLKYDPVIRARLEWGLAMKKKELLASRREMAPLCAKISALWQKHDFLLAPACPFARLTAGEDHTAKRRSLLQMTAPFSLASLPALTFPWGPASKKYGWQILARRGQDHHLISLAKSLSQFSNLA